MSKRFTSTEKWKDKWFYSLKGKYKLLWVYMCDTCDLAGIWEVNLELASRDCGFKYTEAEAFQVLGDRLMRVNDSKWMIRRFIYWQYKCEIADLTPSNLAHRGVINRLKSLGITDDKAPSKGLQRPSEGSKDKYKDKDKSKKKEGERERENWDKKLYGDDVLLYPEEYDKLGDRLGEEGRAWCIQKLDNYLGQSEKNKRKYVSHYKAILNWVVDQWKEKSGEAHIKATRAGGQSRVHTTADIERNTAQLRAITGKRGTGDAENSRSGTGKATDPPPDGSGEGRPGTKIDGPKSDGGTP